MEKTAILATTAYDQFKLLDFNRSISREHVQNLIKSFETHPEIVAATPIIVNERYEVVDGQHRLEACRALHLPVHYLVVPGATIAAAQVLNASQRQWRLLDFARSYAGAGNPDYQQYLRWLEDYQPIAPSALLAVVLGAAGGGSLSKLFRKGEFVITDEAAVQSRLNLLSRYQVVTDHWRTPGFTRAIATLSKLDGFDHDRMIEQLAGNKLSISYGAGQTQYLRELETVYNKGRHTYLRFF